MNYRSDFFRQNAIFIDLANQRVALRVRQTSARQSQNIRRDHLPKKKLRQTEGLWKPIHRGRTQSSPMNRSGIATANKLHRTSTLHR